MKELFGKIVGQLETLLDKNNNHLNMSSIILSSEEEYYSHYFGEREKIDVRSIAKPIVCLAVGAAIEDGLYFAGSKIDLDTHVWRFISQYVEIDDEENKKKWENVTLFDLLRITLGHDKGLLFSSDIKNKDESALAAYVVNYPIIYDVGKHFVYSNAGTFLISTLITEFLGMNADEFVDTLIFSKMGIIDYRWKKYGKYCAACTGLKMYNEDLHKIGQLILNNGVFMGEQIVPAYWIEEMRKPQVQAPTHRYISDRAFPKWSYGMNLWICEDGNYYCDGTEGQYLVVIPNKKIVVTTTGYQSDTQPVSECLGLLK